MADEKVMQPMGVGGWQSTYEFPGPPIPSRFFPGIVPECNQPCCRPWSAKVREMIEVYGPAFFSDGMGV